MTNRMLQVVVIAIAVLLSACTDAPVREVTQPIAVSELQDELGECIDEAELEPDVAAALPSCPWGSTRYCNGSGDCRCCWYNAQICCPIDRPYVIFNQSGDYRCHATPF